MFDPITRWQNWQTLHELVQHSYNEFEDYLRKVKHDDDLPNYLIVGRAFENLLNFIESHEKKLDCEVDAYEEAREA